MKRIFILLLIFTSVLVSGCSNTETPTNTPSDTTATNSDSTPVFTDPIKDYDTVDDSSTEGFTVKAKKYKYEDNNVLLLNVKNTTKTNYSVSVNVDFCDSTGNTIKTETQTFEGYAAGYENFFAFEPGIPFDSYTYKINVEEYNGECYAQHVDVWFDEIYEKNVPSPDRISKGDFTKYPTLSTRVYEENSSSYDFTTLYKLILVDNTGDIYTIMNQCGGIVRTGAKDSYQNYILLQCYEGELIWPEELKYGVSGICVIEDLVTYEGE